jgi:tetratricopeptide (TPR) repeat protein
VACRRRYPWLAVGWFWYVGMLVPVIGLVQVGQQAMADRYTYLPQIGLAIALAWQANSVLGSWSHRAWAYGAAAAIVLLALMRCAYQQASHWRDSETLWNRALACTSDNVLAHVGLGVALREQGRVAEAIQQDREAVKIQPGYVVARTNLGESLCDQGQVDEAIAELEEAVRLKPDYAEAHNGLGAALAKKRRFEESIAQYQQALALDPGSAKAHNNWGVALRDQRRTAEAITHYEAALAINPRYAEAHYNYGIALAAQEQLDAALAEYGKALEIKPDYAEARINLGNALHRLGRAPEAVAQWGEVVRRQPNNASVLSQLAWVLATSPEAAVRNGARAVELAQRAVQLRGGGNLNDLDALAAACAEAGRFDEAVATAQQAQAFASRQGKTSLAAVFETRIKLYRAHRPYRDTGSR